MPFERYDGLLTTPDLVILELVAETREDAAAQLAEKMFAAGRVSDLAGFLAQVNAREHQLATG
ncbi:PTS sugar transporter subunit IIA, partial [Escherichia coli]|nr:PTS sugar transporter subunit IIA [Escherichia coli]